MADMTEHDPLGDIRRMAATVAEQRYEPDAPAPRAEVIRLQAEVDRLNRWLSLEQREERKGLVADLAVEWRDQRDEARAEVERLRAAVARVEALCEEAARRLPAVGWHPVVHPDAIRAAIAGA